jgi:hypothetical protein
VNVEEAIERFRLAAIEKGDFAEAANADHRLHREMAMAWRELNDKGVSGRDAFKRLLGDKSVHVRAWVAAQLLSEGDRDAVAVLEELANGNGMGGFTARMTLKEWRANRLSSPFDGAA